MGMITQLARPQCGVEPAQREVARGQMEADRPRPPLDIADYEFPPPTQVIAPVSEFVAWLRETDQLEFMGFTRLRRAYQEYQLMTGTTGLSDGRFQRAFNRFAKRDGRKLRDGSKVTRYRLRSATMLRFAA